MTGTRVILVSDSHLSADAPESGANWAAVVRYITQASPDLVVHLGDMSLDGARSQADLEFARRELELLPVPWCAVPGNHDVGDNPLPGRLGATDVGGSSLSGQARQLHLDGTDHLWVPTTWAVLPDEVQPALGAKRSGLVSLEFAPDARPEPQFAEPDGMVQMTITVDFPDPYQRH